MKNSYKLQKIMLDGGFTCPNRDGSKGVGGCIFCRTDSFAPDYCRKKPDIREQIEEGKKFFSGKYPNMKYLAYFQSYSGTYAPFDELVLKYESALSADDIVGLIIATRPDCLSDQILDYLSEIKKRGYIVNIELGLESLYDKTLQLINRCHTLQDGIQAIKMCHEAKIDVTVHLIFGLPGERWEDLTKGAEIINSLPISNLKIHQLQILRGTAIEKLWNEHPEQFLPLTLDEYVANVAGFISLLRPDINVERYASSAPPSLLISPRWGIKPSEVERMINSRLKGLQHST